MPDEIQDVEEDYIPLSVAPPRPIAANMVSHTSFVIYCAAALR